MNKASGFLMYYNNSKGFLENMPKKKLVLVLKDINGKGDFPKGVLLKDANESLIQCAIRETKEETGLIENINFKIINNSYFCNNKGLHIFLAEVLLDSGKLPEIKFVKNPETDIIEHTEHYWLTYKEAFLLLPSYLKKFLKAYRDEIND
jgi:8-oxo-dGTP pyrophosphatase MutT (NUDIX family)